MPAEPPVTLTADTAPATVPRVHFPGLEGLRAIAALMVVVHHAAALAGPEVTSRLVRVPAAVLDGGVAVFFVLSGFLIYRPFAVAHHHGTPAPAARAFWWRRLLRLVPAYWLALTVLWALGSFQLGTDWWRYYLFLQTYTRTTTLCGLGQAWSLCVEVAFYLLVPLWAGGLRRLVSSGRRSARVDLLGCALLYVLGFVARQVITEVNPRWRSLSFQWLLTNIDLFAIGMAVAVVSVWAAEDRRLGRIVERAARPAALWWAAALVLFGWYAVRVGGPTLTMIADPNGAYAGRFWHQRQFVLGLFTALILVPSVFGPQDRGPIRQLLAWRPVHWLGVVSFGIYLWHLDLMKRLVPATSCSTGERQWEGWSGLPAGGGKVWVLLAFGLATSIVVAAASWYGVERPLQRYRDRFGR